MTHVRMKKMKRIQTRPQVTTPSDSGTKIKKTNKIKQRNNLDQKIIQTINTFANFFLIAIRIPHGEK